MKRLFVIFFVIGLASSALADRLSNDQYILYGDPSPTGGQRLENSEYILHDAKGQAVGGKFSDGFILIPGILPLVVRAPVEAGVVTNCRITRTDDNKIKLTWSYDGSVDIWRLAGEGQEYSTAGVWEIVNTDEPIHGTEFIEQYINAVNVGDGINAYYRVVPTGTLPGNIHDPALNETTVGKVDIALASGYNFVSMPMISSIGFDISSTFTGQLDIDGVEVYSFDEGTGNLVKAKYGNNTWKFSPDTPFTILMGRSYWVRLPAAGTISLLGAIKTDDFTKNMLASRYLVIGNPFPKMLDFDSALPAAGTNELYWFHNDTKILEKMKNVNGVWINASPGQPVYGFYPGAGYWFRNRGGVYDWVITRP